MKTLTKEQIEKLTPEQQEAVATVELSRARERQRLREQARSYLGRRWFPPLMWVGICALLLLRGGSQAVLAMLLVALTVVIIQFHANGLNRRLDALMELLELDRIDDSKPGRPD